MAKNDKDDAQNQQQSGGQEQGVQQAIATPGAKYLEHSGDKIWVACKLPNGFVLRAHEMKKTVEATLGGHREIESARQVGAPFKINGSAQAIGFSTPHRIVHGYGLTQVPRDLWEAWLKVNRDSGIIKNAMANGFNNEQSAVAWAAENAGRHSGLEPMVEGDKRAKKLLAPGVVAIEQRPGAGAAQRVN